MIKITRTIKTLILEFVNDNGPGHVREILLQVLDFRPEVPLLEVGTGFAEKKYEV